MDKKLLNDLLKKYIDSPKDPENNFSLALYYNDIGQTASAVSFYLRTAELTNDTLLRYECLIRASMCFDEQGCRGFTVKGLLQHAIAILPKRPEAYFLLSRFYEKERKPESWKECYFIASIGDSVCEYKNNPPLRTKVDYPGDYGILFEKAVSSWWCGLCDESRDLFIYLKENYDLDEIHTIAVDNNLKSLNSTNKDLHSVYLPKKYRQFDWGVAAENDWFRKTVEKEIFVEDLYQKFFRVEEGDIVFDVGASAGPFTYFIKDQNPKKVYCFEPYDKLYPTLVKNVECENVVCIPKAILETDGQEETLGLFNETLTETCSEKNRKTVDSIKFKTFVKQNKIKRIDFLKTDCEGGEYHIFNDENFEWVKNNVKKIAGEFHLTTPEQKQQFRKFRDTYLKTLSNHEVFSIDNVNIKHDLWSDWFIEYYSIITLYIDNRFGGRDRWRNSIAPTMEFTTSIDTQNGCVVDCVFCPQRTLQKSYKGERFMTLDNFKKAVDKLPQEVRVTFAGFTEPWLNKDCTDMVLYAHETGHPISIFTTGIGMSIEDIERIKHIPFAGNPNGCFTLHLPDQERKAKHPITKRYIQVIEHIGKIQHEIHNFTTMCMGNVHEDVRHVFPSAPVYDMWSRAGNLVGEMIMKPELLERKAEWKMANHGDKQMTCGCLEKMYHNVMLPNGDVSLCCMDYGLKHILGNLYEQDYEDIVPENKQCFELCRLCENAVEP